MLHLAVFASGRGSNLRAIDQAITDGRLDARVVAVISNRAASGALDFAREHGIPALSLSEIAAEAEDSWLQEQLAKCGCDFISLAGYMKLLPAGVVSAYRHRITNIHPALLPSFGGKGMFGRHVHEAVLASGAKVSGATVHLVDEEYDRGPIVMQRCVPIADDDTAERLAARVLEIEHRIYPESLQLFADGRVTVRDNKTSIRS